MEVSYASNLPVLPTHTRYHLAGSRVPRPPDRVVSGDRVAPQDVGLAIAIGVGDPRNDPSGSGHRRNRLRFGGIRASPDHIGDVRGIAPQHILLSISVESACTYNIPI